jgi:hypothetical protein
MAARRLNSGYVVIDRPMPAGLAGWGGYVATRDWTWDLVAERKKVVCRYVTRSDGVVRLDWKREKTVPWDDG